MEQKGEIRIQTFKNEYGLIDTWTYRDGRLVKAEYTYPKGKLKTKKKEMTQKERLFEQIDTNYQQFVVEHNGKTKKSQASARKHIGEIKKLVTAYRKASVDEAK